MIRIYGASDDLVEIEGSDNADEVDCGGNPVLITLGQWEVSSGDVYGARIRMRYVDPGVWSAEVAQLDDQCRIPWPIHLEVDESGYSVAVCIDAPSDTPLKWEVER